MLTKIQRSPKKVNQATISCIKSRERVVDLTRDLVDKNHKMYFDNFFNSIPLLIYLQEERIYGCGIMRQNRKHIPKLAADKDMHKGDIDYSMLKNGVVCMKWKDNCSVRMESNFHDPFIVELVRMLIIELK